MSNRTVFRARRVANASVTSWLPDHAVVVEDGRIAAVVPWSELSIDARAADVQDLGDVSLLPGLIDAHSHMHCSATPDAYDLVTSEPDERLLLRAARNVRAALLSGVTTLRDVGSRNQVAFPIRDAVHAGVIPGPRLLLSGTPITTTAGHCHMFGTEADTLDQVLTASRRQRKLGADCIKVMATGGMFTPTANPRALQYSTDVLRAVVEEADRLGVPVAAHTLSAAGTRACIEAGVHHVVHGRWLSADPTRSLEYEPDLAKRMADSGQWVDITVGLMLLQERAAAACLPPAPRHWAMATRPVSRDEQLETALDMRLRGVRFMTGLDMGMVHAGFSGSWANAAAFVRWLDYSPWQALAASTVDTAEALGLGRVTGRLAPGLAADLLAVSGDPAVDIAALAAVTDVVLAGTPVVRAGSALV